MVVKCVFLFNLVLFCVTLSGQNLVKNSDFDKPLDAEISISSYPGMEKSSIFTEDLNQNKCLKLEVLKYKKHPKTGNPFYFQRLYIGGRKQGIPVNPNTIYSYSFELKGNVKAKIFIQEWAGKKKKKLKVLPLVKDLSTKEWKIMKGSFKTSSDATGVAICIDIAGYVSSMLPKIGDYLLVDKIYLAKKANL